MLIDHNRQKLIEAIIYFALHTRNCGKTKLMKLLYYLDFMHFRQTGKSVTGLDYYAWDLGPVPADLWQELSDEHDLPADLAQAISIQPIPRQSGGEMSRIVARQKFEGRYFSPREMKLLSDVADVFKEATADQIVEAAHLKNQPWDRTIQGQGYRAPIDYMLAVDGSSDALSEAVVQERREEMAEMQRFFADE
jgi:uncharacterized phage-associated protein